MDNLLDKFDSLVSRITDILKCPDTGVEDVEVYLDELLSFINSNLERKDEFEKKFKDMLYAQPNTPLEIYWYCMHELRWLEVYNSVVDYKKNSTDLRCKRYAELILECFSSEWKDAVIFSKYRN
jgi:hypothetical protein